MADLILSLEQRNLFRRAIESSYSDFKELKVLVSFELGTKLGISDATDLGAGLAKIIEWAENNGRTRELSDARLGDRPQNSDVITYADLIKRSSHRTIRSRNITEFVLTADFQQRVCWLVVRFVRY